MLSEYFNISIFAILHDVTIGGKMLYKIKEFSVRSVVFVRIVKSDVNKHEGMMIPKLPLPSNHTVYFRELKILQKFSTHFKIILTISLK
jgi:hypothetical protein